MSYNIAGAGMRSAACRALMRRCDMTVEEGVEATMLLEVGNAFLEQDAPGPGESVGRPYLTLVGRVAELRGDFPCDVSTIRFQEVEDRPVVTYRYELSRENLVAMCSKGMFEPGFVVPRVVRENDFELPCSVSCAALVPRERDEAPVVFADIEASSLECDDETSGYTIDEYFDEVPRTELGQDRAVEFVPESISPERASELLDEEGVEAPDVEDENAARPDGPDSGTGEGAVREDRVPARVPSRAPASPRGSQAGRGRLGGQEPAAPAARPVAPAVEDEPDLDLGEDYL